MKTKSSEDVIPLAGLKVNLGKFVNRANDNHHPILVTSRGRGKKETGCRLSEGLYIRL